MARPRREDPALVRTDGTADALVEALNWRFKTPFRDICRDLRASRSWAEKYVRHAVPHVYVSGPVTLEMLRAHYGLLSRGSSRTWYDTEAYMAWADGCGSAWRRTKAIPEAAILPDPGAWVAAADEIFGPDLDKDDREAVGYAFLALGDVWSDIVKGSPASTRRLLDSVHTPRGSVAWEKCDWTPSELGLARGDLQTAASMLDWGEASETAHRRCVSSSRFFVNHHPILSGLSTKDLRISPRAAGPTLPSCFPA